MRLLRTGPVDAETEKLGVYEPGHEKFELAESSDLENLNYAILSHRCSAGDVTYEQVRMPTDFEHRIYSTYAGVTYENARDQSVRECEGYNKVAGAMRQAASAGHKYIWIDSCCIDKSSSAEHSESINSMYAWYQKATVCYAFLDNKAGSDTADPEALFKKSTWFDRGWTLQELLVPEKVEFFGESSEGSWVKLGDRASLRGLVSTRTGIPTMYLTGPQNLHLASVAQKMSWVARRETTRDEDIAYCLLGLFSVNMPLLYGEGTRAFMRLQEEIMKISDDQTIFAWMQGPNDHAVCDFEQADFQRLGTHELRQVDIEGPKPEIKISWEDTSHGLLAYSPKAFSMSGEVFRRGHIEGAAQVPYEMTNRGLSISLYLTPLSDRHSELLFRADLECDLRAFAGDDGSDDVWQHICLYLRKKSGPTSNQYTRLRCEKLATLVKDDIRTPESANLTGILVR
jgi:hypothetical protein